MKTEKILQPPEATGELDLEAAHRDDIELTRMMCVIRQDDELRGEAIVLGLDDGTIDRTELAKGVRMAIDFGDLNVLKQIEHKCVKEHARLTLADMAILDAVMDEPPGGELES